MTTEELDAMLERADIGKEPIEYREVVVLIDEVKRQSAVIQAKNADLRERRAKCIEADKLRDEVISQKGVIKGLESALEIERLQDVVEYFAMFHPAELDAAFESRRAASMKAAGHPDEQEQSP